MGVSVREERAHDSVPAGCVRHDGFRLRSNVSYLDSLCFGGPASMEREADDPVLSKILYVCEGHVRGRGGSWRGFSGQSRGFGLAYPRVTWVGERAVHIGNSMTRPTGRETAV